MFLRHISMTLERYQQNQKTIHRVSIFVLTRFISFPSFQGIERANTRHRHSISAVCWLKQRSENRVPLGTIFQAYYKARKSATQVEEPDLKDAKNDK